VAGPTRRFRPDGKRAGAQALLPGVEADPDRGSIGPPTSVPLQPLTQELTLLPDLTPDAEIRLGRDGRCVAASASLAQLLGYVPAELVGRPGLEFVRRSERAAVEGAVRAALAVADSVSLRLELVRSDGTPLRADVRFDAVRDRSGAVREQRVTVRDAAGRSRADELRSQWEALFQVTRRGIAVTDPHTKALAAVNPAFAAMHGGTVEDFVGLPVARVLTPQSAERLAALAAQIDEAGFVSYDSEHVRIDGSMFPAAVETMAARDEHGEQRYWLTWVEDLTERRLAERDTARHADEMARSNADLDRFAGVVSHDLQSPMRVIAGCARILERRSAEHLTAEERELVEHIVGGVHRMTALLDGIREWSQVRGEAAPKREVDCGAVVDGVLSSLAADLDAAGASVRGGARAAVPEPDRQCDQVPRRAAARDRHRRERRRRGVGVHGRRQRHRDRYPVRRARVRVRPAAAQRGRVPRDRDRADRLQDRRRASRRAHLGGAVAGRRQPLPLHAARLLKPAVSRAGTGPRTRPARPAAPRQARRPA
jgi:PAS domain S-box-containing protein